MTEFDEILADATKWYDQLEANRAANPPRRKEIVVETSHTVETQRIAVPQDERLQGGVEVGDGTTPTICEGYLTGTWVAAPPEDLFDVILDLPYDITVTQIVLFVSTGAYSIQLGYGAGGAGVSFMSPSPQPAGTDSDDGPTDADGIIGPTTIGELILSSSKFMLVSGELRGYSMNQVVPMGGYLQLNTDDRTDAGSITYFVHYTYHCADGGPL